MDVKTAAFNVGHDFKGGVVALAQQIGKNPNTLNGELASIGTAKLGLADAVKMTIVAQDFRVLDAFAMQCGRMTLPLPEILDIEDTNNCLEALARTSREYSELCMEVCASLADGHVNANERGRIQREGGQLVASLHQLLAAIDAHHEAGKQGQSDEVSLRRAA